MSAPRDPLFYVDLDAMAQRVGARSEDLLLVWASESDLRTDLSGNSRTFSTLMHYIAVPGIMDEATWQKLPTMSARQQLPYVEKAVYAPAHRGLGRSFRNTFEVYLANAAPGMLRGGGDYNAESVMYSGTNYPDNWPMDNVPAGSLAAQKDGVRITSPRETYEYAKDLVDRGVLKGYVSLGDLASFAKRLMGSANVTGSTFQTALAYLANVRGNVAAKLAPSVDPVPEGFLTWQPASYTPSSGYSPDFDAFSAGAPRDDRVASPTKAKTSMPKRAGGAAPKAISWPALGIGAAVAVGIAYFLRKN